MHIFSFYRITHLSALTDSTSSFRCRQLFVRIILMKNRPAKWGHNEVMEYELYWFLWMHFDWWWCCTIGSLVSVNIHKYQYAPLKFTFKRHFLKLKLGGCLFHNCFRMDQIHVRYESNQLCNACYYYTVVYYKQNTFQLACRLHFTGR